MTNKDLDDAVARFLLCWCGLDCGKLLHVVTDPQESWARADRRKFMEFDPPLGMSDGEAREFERKQAESAESRRFLGALRERP